MSRSQRAKETLANSLKALLKTRPLEKISVKDITENCSMSRNNFYYHFKDKYELISWIFYHDMEKETESFDDPTKFMEKNFANVCNCLYRNREFYLACFKYVEQNSLFEVLTELYTDLWRKVLRERYAKMGTELPEDELGLMARVNTRAMVGMISDWVKKGMKENFTEYSEESNEPLDRECFLVGGKYLMLS